MKNELLTQLGEFIDTEQGGLFRFVATERQVHRKCNIEPSTSPQQYYAQLQKLRYERPKLFMCFVTYMAWRDMDKLDGGFVLFTELEHQAAETARGYLTKPDIIEPTHGGN